MGPRPGFAPVEPLIPSTTELYYSTKKGTHNKKQIHLRIELGQCRGSKRSYTELILPPENTGRQHTGEGG
eukprot:141443-Hanusia_phi.AAC.1